MLYLRYNSIVGLKTLLLEAIPFHMVPSACQNSNFKCNHLSAPKPRTYNTELAQICMHGANTDEYRNIHILFSHAVNECKRIWRNLKYNFRKAQRDRKREVQ